MRTQLREGLPWMEIRAKAGQRGQWLVRVFQCRTSKALKVSQGARWQAPGLVQRNHKGYQDAEDLGADLLPNVGIRCFGCAKKRTEPHISWALAMLSSAL